MLHYLSHEMNTGFLSDEHKKLLGIYSFWESLKKGGVGSSKVAYVSGVSGFDSLLKWGTDLLQINFEIAKNALLIRAWQHGDCFIAYVFWKDIVEAQINSNIVSILLANNSKQGFLIKKV